MSRFRDLVTWCREALAEGRSLSSVAVAIIPECRSARQAHLIARAADVYNRALGREQRRVKWLRPRRVEWVGRVT